MAALTPATKKFNTAGRYRETILELPAVSDGDTVAVPGLGKVVAAASQVEHYGADAVAADTIVIASVSGRTVTFQVAGTARTAKLFARGY